MKPIIIGLSHVVTYLGIFLQIIGSLKTVPPNKFLMVPLGDFHIYFNLNSLTFLKKVNSCFIWGYGGTFYTDFIKLNGLSTI